VRYVHRLPLVEALLLLLAAVSILAGGYSALLPAVAIGAFHGGAHALGALMGAAGAGALVGALLLARRESVRGIETWIIRCGFGLGVGLIALEAAPGALVAVPILFAVGMSLMVMWASINTRVQTLVADDMLGRVMSLYAVAFFGGAPVGALLLGTLATLLGPIHAFALSGVGCLLCTLLFRRALPRLEARARARERALDPKRTAPGTLDLS
jgi:MFS family permease